MNGIIVKGSTVVDFAHGVYKALGLYSDRTAFEDLSPAEIYRLMKHPIFSVFNFGKYAKIVESEIEKSYCPVISIDEALLGEFVTEIEKNPDDEELYAELYEFFSNQGKIHISEEFLLRKFRRLNDFSPESAILLYLFFVINHDDFKLPFTRESSFM